MKNFAKNLEDATDQELYSWVNQLDFRVVPLASDELTRRRIKDLDDSIKQNTEQAKKFTTSFKESSKVAEKFTVALFVLAVVQLLIAVFQLLLSFAYSDNVQIKILGIMMVIVIIIFLYYFGRKTFSKNN
jgi:hypothetical protein